MTFPTPIQEFGFPGLKEAIAGVLRSALQGRFEPARRQRVVVCCARGPTKRALIMRARWISSGMR